jgi:hypothetical protein
MGASDAYRTAFATEKGEHEKTKPLELDASRRDIRAAANGEHTIETP